MMAVFEIPGYSLELLDLPARVPELPPIVLLHEGLGCIAFWRDLPQRIADVTGARVLAWSRPGYGQSTPHPPGRDARYLHREALEIMPQVFSALSLPPAVLFGHSDGGSISLLFAAHFPEQVCGVTVLAPHEFVEPCTLKGVEEAKVLWETTDWPQRLARYHADPQRVFSDWTDIWLSPVFRDWNIEEEVRRIQCPILAIQGEGDEYATMRQIEQIAVLCPAQTTLLPLADCGHTPHRDQPEAVLSAFAVFYARCLGATVQA